MKRRATRWAFGIFLVLLGRGAAGCGSTYDGSASFYAQHPEYNHQPSYMHPHDSSDDDGDPQLARPW